MSLVKLGGLGAKAAKKTAPFYSAVDEALGNLKRPKGTGIEFLTEVLKQPGVKKAEIADRKLEQAFKAKGKMTKEEAQQVLADNPPPNLQERVLEDISDSERQEMLEDSMARYGYDNYRDVPSSRMREFQNEIDSGAVRYNEPDYVTQGGSNYREILLKLPESFTKKDFDRLLTLEAEKRRSELTTGQQKELKDLQKKKQTGPSNYMSTHWDDPNVLAHMRVQDRMIDQPPQKGFYVVNKTSGRPSDMFDTPEQLQAYVETLPESIRNNVTMAQGERKVPPRKVLQVEEIQSDWHQAGRKKGYRNQEAIDKANLAFDEYNKDAKERLRQIMLKESEGEMAPDRALTYVDNFVNGMDPSGVAGFLNEKSAFVDLYRATKGVGGSDIPDAPFKKNWHELAMKRLLNYAAEKGYDGIAITPGAEHFKRYGSERIDWKKGDDGWIVGAKEQTGGRHEGRDLEEIARDRGILLERSGDQVKSKEDLHRIVNTVLNRENNPDQVNKLTNRIWDRMQTEAEGTSLPRKEGMEGFYDKMLTDYLNSYGRDYGAQVQMRQVAATPEAMEKKFNLNPNNLPDMNAEQASDYGKILQGFGNTQLSDVHYFPITQPMRESIKQKGLPLYQQVGIPTAGAGAASQMLEPEEEPQYGTGGGVAKSAIKQAHLAKLAKMREEMAPRAEAVKALIARDQNRYLADVVPNSLTNAEIEAEIRRMAARAKASGQQEGVLPLAEREANKAKYLEKSKEKNVMYHGTDQDISEFRPYTFVTPDPVVANQYPGLGQPRGQNIMPVHVRAENPFDYEIPSHVHKLSSIIKDKELLRDIKDGYWQSIENPDVLEAMQKLGFDSFYSPDMAKNLGVFKPEQIKSAIGNRGTFDPLEREVNKAKGGKVRMTTNRDTMFMELSNKKLKRK